MSDRKKNGPHATKNGKNGLKKAKKTMKTVETDTN